MRRFQLQRDNDVTGVSGIGVVAQGVEFDDGTCAMRWLGEWPSTAFYAEMFILLRIHGHQGATQVVWLDDEPGE